MRKSQETWFTGKVLLSHAEGELGWYEQQWLTMGKDIAHGVIEKKKKHDNTQQLSYSIGFISLQRIRVSHQKKRTVVCIFISTVKS